MVVVVVFVGRVAVAVVEVVDVLAVRDRDVAAALAVGVVVAGVRHVAGDLALVDVPVVRAVQVPFVGVVDVVAVRDGRVPAALTVDVVVACVHGVRDRHRRCLLGCVLPHMSTSDANTG
jgi:hypothetical protein